MRKVAVRVTPLASWLTPRVPTVLRRRHKKKRPTSPTILSFMEDKAAGGGDATAGAGGGTPPSAPRSSGSSGTGMQPLGSLGEAHPLDANKGRPQDHQAGEGGGGGRPVDDLSPDDGVFAGSLFGAEFDMDACVGGPAGSGKQPPRSDEVGPGAEEPDSVFGFTDDDQV